MQKGYRLLVLSGILFVTSVSISFVWGITFSGLFIANNQGLSANQITLSTLHAYNTSIYIDSIDRPLTIAMDSINNDQPKLREIVTDPSGEVISNSTFQKTYFSTIKPNKTGEYEFSVVQLENKSRDDATLYVLFGVLPFLKENGELEWGVFTGLIVGIFLFVGG
ncbi:MAG TPA: hypothetical protein VER14_07180, partial [Phototrophicaceae bacterium]|nr:hypothetical protein [Phototrophicaceae bacterium]